MFRLDAKNFLFGGDGPTNALIFDFRKFPIVQRLAIIPEIGIASGWSECAKDHT